MIRSRCARAALALALSLVAPVALAQSVALVPGMGPVQSFDTLPSSGTTAALPSGWIFAEIGSSADALITADDGSLGAGDTYSYGSIGSAERALGGLQSNRLNPTVGARLSNATGTVVTDVIVQYTGEQWHRGFATDDRLDFQYSLDATSLTDGTWTDVDELDFHSPAKSAAAGALDGNAAANRLAIAGMISGIELAPGATLLVRWADAFAPGGVNDGLAIDDVQFGVPDNAPFVYATAPADLDTNVARSTNLFVTFSEPVTLGAAWYALGCDVSGTHAASVSGGPSAWTIDPTVDFTPGETCTVSIDATQVVDQDGAPNAMAANARFRFVIAPPDAVFKDGFE